MVDDTLARDEAQRAANYEAIKSDVKGEVGGEIAAEAQVASRAEAADIDDIAAGMRQKAVNEVIETDRDVELGRVVARISQVIDYIFFLIYGLLIIRLMLALFAAREGAGFVQFIRNVTDPFYAPFRGIVASPTTPEGFTLAFPIVIALIVYLLLHLAINGLLRMFVHRKTEV
jgi:uncharacterized protein YggT (Ycf19 family)